MPIKLADLPQPPAEISALIELGRVTFEAGPRDASQQPKNGLAAETHYRIAYKYSSRSRWKVAADNKKVVINVRFFAVQWKPTHTIWFRRQPSLSDFWSNELVLHEFDHVRISNDPRFQSRFEESLQKRSVLTRALRAGDVVNRKLVDELVDEHVTEVFSDITELVSIRYKELDRVTDHGRRPVPTDSALNEFLKPDSADSDSAELNED